MGIFEVIPVGDKLKRLREKYKMKQEDLTGGEVTRNLISQIEHSKARLTRSTAEIIFKNLKEICGAKHIDVDESIEYLMEDEKFQANEILDRYVKELKDLSVYKDGVFEGKLNEAEEFLVNWDIRDKKIAIFELAGDYYCGINDFYNSSLYYEKAKAFIDINIHNENIVPIFRKLSMVYFYMGKYEEDIKCCDFALNNFKNMNEMYYCIFQFNNALCHIKLKEYTAAFKRLKNLESVIKEVNLNKYYEVLIQEGVCLQYLKKYEESLEVYNKMLKIIDKNDYQTYVTTLINIADIYIKKSDYSRAKEFLKVISENVNNIDKSSKYIPEIWLDVGRLYEKINDIEKAEFYYVKSLEYAEKYRHYYLMNDILSELCDIYIVKKSEEGILNIKNAFFMLIKRENKINLDIKDKLIKFYLDIEDIQSLRQIYNFVKMSTKGSDNFVFEKA